MRFITDRAVDQIAALQDVPADDRVRTLADADRVYLYIRRSEGQRDGVLPGAPEEALRTWGEQNDLDPDRMNLALAILQETGRVVAVD
jgi:hypothetical protein